MDPVEADQMLSGDRPLIHPDQDLLGYAPFAETLATALQKMVPTEGMVVAVQGPWGSGKSTVLNFVRHYLEEDSGEEGPIIFRFSPWWYSGREDLTLKFFAQMRVQVGDRVPELREHLASFGEAISSVPTEYLELLPYIGSYMGRAKKALAMLSGAREEKDVVALKAKIEKALRDQDRRIIVLIDDVDRLTPDEIRMMFRTIKAVADFPNVLYLLAFDREVVHDAIEGTFRDRHSGYSDKDEFQNRGANYLEKIIQVVFDLPPIEQLDLRKMLFERLDVILAETIEDFDQHYWADVYFGGIDDLINTPREVMRLTNALQATYPAVQEEVNPVDFVAIEAVRLFEPGLYRVIRDHKGHFAGNPRERERDPIFGDGEETVYDRWLARLSAENREAIKGILSSIFPKFAAQYGGSFYDDGFLNKWRRQRRICSPDVFPIYFRLSVSQDDISEAEMQGLLQLSEDAEAFGQRLVDFSEQKCRDGTTRARIALRRLNDYVKEDILEEDIPSVVSALFRVGSELMKPEDRGRGMHGFGNDIRLSRLLFNLLRQVDEQERFEVLSAAIRDGRSVSLAEHLIAVIGQQYGKFGADPAPEEERLVTAEHLRQLEGQALTEIREAAEEGSLLDEPELWSILDSWRTWTDNDQEVREWVEAIIAESDEALARLLEVAKGEVRFQTVGSYAVREQPRLDPKWFEPFLDPDDVIDRVRNLEEEGDLTEEQHIAAQQFIEEYELRQQGKDPKVYYQRPRG